MRLIDRYVDFRFVRERLKGFYSLTGRSSIDPEVLLRLLLVGYLYGCPSPKDYPCANHSGSSSKKARDR